jgi:beta-aspartyl-peptidase (threonine type)
VKNPISLARMVMTETRHVLLAGPGAEEFAREMKVEMVTPDYFDTPQTKAAWERQQQRRRDSSNSSLLESPAKDEDLGSYYGTVGCVALDSHGNLAAATSTGGMSNKKFGRVGDSPIVGAGTYANNETCAVSCTGTGEQFIRHAIAYDISAQMKYSQTDVDSAVKKVLDSTLNKNDGGIIAVSKTGQISMRFNTAGMASAAADSQGRFEIVWGDEPAGER